MSDPDDACWDMIDTSTCQNQLKSIAHHPLGQNAISYIVRGTKSSFVIYRGSSNIQCRLLYQLELRNSEPIILIDDLPATPLEFEYIHPYCLRVGTIEFTQLDRTIELRYNDVAIYQIIQSQELESWKKKYPGPYLHICVSNLRRCANPFWYCQWIHHSNYFDQDSTCIIIPENWWIELQSMADAERVRVRVSDQK